MVPEGVKTAMTDDIVNTKFMDRHLQIGIDSLTELINHGVSVKHLRFNFFASRRYIRLPRLCTGKLTGGIPANTRRPDQRPQRRSPMAKLEFHKSLVKSRPIR
jgi:hypothetical protein